VSSYPPPPGPRAIYTSHSVMVYPADCQVWPIMLAFMFGTFSIVYYFGPALKKPEWRSAISSDELVSDEGADPDLGLADKILVRSAKRAFRK
jgi:hypothetical protein